jgi:DeoR family fructose operon transcriptional repressor
MVGAARRVVCLTDASKVGTEAAIRFAALDEIDVVVTDGSIGAGAREALEAAGPEVVVA